MTYIKNNPVFLVTPYILGAFLIFGAFGYIFYTMVSAEQQKAQLLAQQQIEEIAQNASSSIQAANASLLDAQGKLAVSKQQIQKIISDNIHANSSPTKLSNSQIINKVKPAVVYIETNQVSGSGMIISSDGYILTNAHVVTGVSVATVTLSTGTLYSAYVAGRDEIKDLAILKITATNLPVIGLGDSDTVTQGDDIFAFGFPFGIKGDVSFSAGSVARWYIEDGSKYIQHTAQIEHGSSGGPLVNNFGRVIGINFAGYTPNVLGNIQLGETLKFAIPTNIARSEISQLENGLTLTFPIIQPTPTYTPPIYTPPTQSDQTIGEDYFKTNHTCVGLNDNQYSYCISYAYNH